MNKLKDFIFRSFLGHFGPADTTEVFFFFQKEFRHLSISI